MRDDEVASSDPGARRDGIAKVAAAQGSRSAAGALLLCLALLAGCDGPAPAPRPTAAAAAGYAAKVAALSDTLRAGVLLRAIRDAGQPCQKVVSAQPAGRSGAFPAWAVTCDDHGQWVVAIADDGTAIVANARDLARGR